MDIITTQNTNLVYEQDKAIVDMQIATAKLYPRDITKAVNNSIAIVTLDKDTAEDCHYALPRSGKTITGPTVQLAKILAQNWGNIRCESKVIAISDKHITSQAIAFDLENNFALKVEVERSITTKNGRMTEDMITVTGNAGNAIALRNAIFGVIPKNVIDQVYKSAIQKITGDLSNENKFIAQRKSLIEFFEKTHGVSENEILYLFGKPAINNLTREDLMTLHGIATAIKNGDTTIQETFRAKPAKEKVEIKDEIIVYINEDANTIEALKKVEDKLKTNEQIEAYIVKLTLLNQKLYKDKETVVEPPKAEKATEAQLKLSHTLLNEAEKKGGEKVADAKDSIKSMFQVNSTKDLTKNDIQAIITNLQN